MDLDSRYFPADMDWLQDSFKNLEEIFNSTEYFSQYINKRFPVLKDFEPNRIQSHFIVDRIDVEFVPKEQCPRKLIKVAYGSASLQIMIPDDPDLTEKEKDYIRDYYQGIYFSRLKESHIRMHALLWYLLPDEEKNNIQKSVTAKL